MTGRADRDVPERMMALAAALARRARPSPNPPVGAVVARGSRVVGKGWHHRAGSAHAEAIALADAGAMARGADLYVTLEPCNHRGRTPPCAPAVVRAGIRRVFIGARDPNPNVRGGGTERLRAAGIEVVDLPLGGACDRLLDGFRRHVTTGRPFVTVKIGATLDGRIAARTGRSKWITGPAARRRVQEMRSQNDAILVGGNTLRLDDPRLTVRGIESESPPPLRVIVTRDLRGLDPEATVLATARTVPTVVFHPAADERSVRRLRRAGVRTVALRPGRDGFVRERDVIEALGSMGVMSVLVEGGALTFTRFLSAGLVDRLALFVAPLALGGPVERCWFRHEGVDRPDLGLRFESMAVERVGDDLMITATPGRARRRAGSGTRRGGR